jgi:hypothetical protein
MTSNAIRKKIATNTARGPGIEVAGCYGVKRVDVTFRWRPAANAAFRQSRREAGGFAMAA